MMAGLKVSVESEIVRFSRMEGLLFKNCSILCTAAF